MTDTAATTAPVAHSAPEPTSRDATTPLDDTIEANEIRVTAQGKMRNYVAYAATIFSENKSHTVVLKGMGRVINKTVSLAEILKRRVKGLYQLAEIGSIEVMDQKPGKGDDEGKDVMRLLSVIKIVLTTDPEDSTRFQPPIDESQVEPVTTPLPKRARVHKKRNKAKKTKDGKAVGAVTVVEEKAAAAAPAEKAVEVKEGGGDSEVVDKKNEKENNTKGKQKRRRPNKRSKKAAAAATSASEKDAVANGEATTTAAETAPKAGGDEEKAAA